MITESTRSAKLWPISLIIFLLINHFSNYQISHFDGNGYIVILLSIIYLIVNKSTYRIKPFLNNHAIVIWFVLMCYHIVNAIYKGATEGLESQSILPGTIINILLMTLCSYMYVINKRFLLWTIFVSLTYYLLVAYNFNTMLDDGRFSGFLYTTQLGQMSGVLCIIISLLIYEKKNFMYAILYTFPVFMMILAGSRNGLLTVLFSLAVLAAPYFFQRRNSILLVGILALILYNNIQGSLVMERTDNSEYILEYETGTFLDYILGDRLFYYIVGWTNYIENPLTGIGLLNFAEYNAYRYPIHSEPMTHLCEGGLVGAVLYLLFKWQFVKVFIIKCRVNTLALNQCLVVFVALIFIGLTARIYHYEFFFPLYGIILGEIYNNNEKNEDSIIPA